jgi:5-deoxy-glucuronate isomerase
MTATTSSPHHLRSVLSGGPIAIGVDQAGWGFLDFAIHRIDDGETLEVQHEGREVAVVPLAGAFSAHAGSRHFELSRKGVFAEPPHVLYVPPRERLVLCGKQPSEIAIGGAPAEGHYSIRLFRPEEMRVELRGGETALRQVNHILAAPLPAERLILYEIVAPRGSWCGWPPHCHDGFDGSPYLEETYYFRFDRPEGYAIHHNYRVDEPFDELFIAGDGDVVLVSKGYHTTVASPGSRMYFLNYLAGELRDDDRSRPPCFDSRHSWIAEDWQAQR